MFKIWAKTIKEEKITRDLLYKREDKFNADNFLVYLIDICHSLDIPTPIVLKSHTKNFSQFNITRFKMSDFVESIDFDILVLEFALEK